MASDLTTSSRSTLESYDRLGVGYQVHVDCDWRRALDEYTLLPQLDALQLDGLTVLDVGAGTGRWSRAALRRGASTVYALEPSATMADAARELERKEREAAAEINGDGGGSWSDGRVHHLLGDVVDCSALATIAADVAIVGYVLHYLHSTDQVLRAMRDVRGAMRPGGSVIGVTFCVEADAPLAQHSPMPRHSIILPDGNVEWREAHAKFADPPFDTVIFVQRWETLRRLMEEAGFRRVERLESQVDGKVLSAMTADEASAMVRYARQCAFFRADV